MRAIRQNSQIKLLNLPLPKFISCSPPDIRNSPTRIGKKRIILNLKIDSPAHTHTVHRGKGQLFTSTAYKQYVEELRWLILNELREKLDDPETIYGIRCRFFLPGRVKTGDIDNLIKPIMDAGIGLVWHNDSQIWELNASLIRDWEISYSEFLIYSIMKWTSKIQNICMFCGNLYEHYQGEGKNKYCSFACYKAHIQHPKKCDYCERTFTTTRIRGHRHIFCSLECNYAYRKEHSEEFKGLDGKFI